MNKGKLNVNKAIHGISISSFFKHELFYIQENLMPYLIHFNNIFAKTLLNKLFKLFYIRSNFFYHLKACKHFTRCKNSQIHSFLKISKFNTF